MKTITTITTANIDALTNVFSNAQPEKWMKMERTGAHPYWTLLAKTAKKIACGAVRIEGAWYPVLNGEVDRINGFNYSHGATNLAVQNAKALGYTVKANVTCKTIEVL